MTGPSNSGISAAKSVRNAVSLCAYIDIGGEVMLPDRCEPRLVLLGLRVTGVVRIVCRLRSVSVCDLGAW